MKFESYVKKLHKHFEDMTKDANYLFEVDVDKDELWDTYLESFPPEYNQIFRERRAHDCSCCRSFIRRCGNLVSIKNNKVTTLWDFEVDSNEYSPVVNAMSEFLKTKLVTDVYVTKDNRIGTPSNKELLDTGNVLTWNHLFLDFPNVLVDKSNRSEGDIKGSFRDIKNVFKRSLDEISIDSVETVLELISSNTLYKGEEWGRQLDEFLKYKKEYEKLEEKDRNNYTWEKSGKVGAVIGKIRNHSIGTLLVNISEGMDLDTAVKKYESIVAPSNYKRPKAIFTKKMLEDAKNKINELGLMDSLKRRHATLDDITANNILFVNKDSAKRMSERDVFDEMENEVSLNPKKFSKVEEISVDKFISNVLPSAKEVEVLLENKHSSNMVSLIAPEVKDSKNMFKWGNNFGWAYSGNITDSSMRENVKSAGGKVDGVLRFSIQWNDIQGEHDANDLDAHCIEPSGNRIYFGAMVGRTGGRLDVDNRHPKNGIPAVENITWSNKNNITNGKYAFLVNQYDNRGGRRGFKAEIEFDGVIHSFEYNKELRTGQNVIVAEVMFKDGEFSISEKLPSTTSSKEVWGLATNQFVPVSTLMYSPNYWDEQEGIGHRHVFFMLKDCVNTEEPNGFYNEFLKQDLLEYKRVFEALGGKMKVGQVEDQLSGIGFSTTKRNEVVVRVTGQTQRTMKIKF